MYSIAIRNYTLIFAVYSRHSVQLQKKEKVQCAVIELSPPQIQNYVVHGAARIILHSNYIFERKKMAPHRAV